MKEEISENWLRLIEAVPDIEQYILEDKIKIIRLKRYSKEPLDSNYYFKEVTLEELKKHDGNYGIIVGFNNGKNGISIAGADIDGLTIKDNPNITEEKKKEIKQLTKKFIYNSLKESLPNPLAVRTQSTGYHFYLWNETEVNNFHDVSKSLTFPSDFPIEELRNKPLEHSIEIFTKFKTKYLVLPSAVIKDNKTGEVRTYKVISDVNKLSDIGTVNNIHDTVKESLIAKSYGLNESSTSTSNRKKSRSTNRNKNNSSNNNLKKLSDKDIKKVVELITDKYKVFSVIDGAKHEGTLALGGYFNYHITKNSSRKIASGIIKKIGSIFNDSGAFKKTLLESYERPIEEKAGLPTLLDLIEDYDSTFNINRFSEELNLICNNKFRKEKVATATINKIKVPVYLMENNYNKWLKYEGIIKGIDLTLDINYNVGSFRYSKTGKEVDSFKFKFHNKYFEIIKFKELEEFLESEEIELPKHFEKQIRRSLKSLDKSIFKPKEQPSTEVEIDVGEDPNFIKFGKTEEGFYSQLSTGIEYNKYIKNGTDISSKPIANVVIKELSIVLDSLEILEPVYNVTYENLTFNKEITVKYLTKKQLTEEFIKANVFYNSTKENIDTVLNAFIIDGAKEGRIETRTEAYLEGFFIVNNKVVSNTKLKNLKKYTSEDVAEAINLLNEIMEDRTEEGKANDSAVYRFMLWNPFSYCLKQLGYSKGIYSLILTGKSQANKTGATNIGRLFYLHNEEESSASTVSVLGSKLEENSFVSVFDECSHLFYLAEALNVMKRLIYEKTARATKDRNDNKKIDEFQAIGLAMFLLNEKTIDFKDYITNRYKIIDYTSESVISKEDKEKFEEKYLPEAEDTVLKKLAIIGKVFSEKLIAIIEDPTERKKLFNIEKLTIEILKEIQEEAGVNFNNAMLQTTEASTKYNYDIESVIRNLFNSEFKKRNKVINNEYIPRHFKESIKNNDFDFITYNRYRTEKTKDREFIINSSGLVKYVNNHKDVEETVELTNVLEYLGLTSILKKKAKKINVPYEKFIDKQYKIKVEGNEKKVIKGFYLTTEELINNLFNFNLDFSENDSSENDSSEN